MGVVGVVEEVEITEVVVVVVVMVEADAVKWLREPSSLVDGNLHTFLGVSLLDRRRYMLDSNQIIERIILLYQIPPSNFLSL